MLRTLHSFLARELAKVTLLSLVAFTLVMTVFAIIEPFRKRGLSTDQVLSFLGYTLPAMVSLTLPVAALFAATIVYGRLSQDNELLACRAGGIATLSLLEPAIVLGVLVTAASLWLSNSVTPYLAGRAEQAIRGNLREIAYYQLRTQGSVRYESYIVHADRVDAAHDMLYGVVLCMVKTFRDPNARVVQEVTVVAADRARVDFRDVQGEPYVVCRADRPVFTRSTEFSIGRAEQPTFSFPLTDRGKDDPAWYSWGRLVETLRNPALNGGIRRSLKALCSDLGYEMLVAEVVSTIRSGRPYTKLRGGIGRVEISAPGVQMDPNLRRPLEAELLARADPSGVRKPVVVRVIGERAVRTLEADRCRVQVGLSPMRNAPVVSLELDGDVRVRVQDLAEGASPATVPSSAPAEEDWTRRQKAEIGDLDMPGDLAEATSRLDPNLVLANVTQMSTDPAVLSRFHNIVNRDMVRLQGQIQAEMHGRLAYGLSCFLMVAMGAALGLMFRGGQLLSAFVLSVVPAAVVIILVVMGKQILGNPGVARAYGLLSIWGGIAALLVGDIGLLVRLARK